MQMPTGLFFFMHCQEYLYCKWLKKSSYGNSYLTIVLNVGNLSTILCSFTCFLLYIHASDCFNFVYHRFINN